MSIVQFYWFSSQSLWWALGEGIQHQEQRPEVADKYFSMIFWIFGNFSLLRVLDAHKTTVSTVNYRDMGQGMGQRISLKIHSNLLLQEIKEKFRNRDGFGTFMVAEAGLEPTTSGL